MEDLTFEAGLSYIVKLLLKKKFVLQNPQGINHRHMWTEITKVILNDFIFYLNLFGIVFMTR